MMWHLSIEQYLVALLFYIRCITLRSARSARHALQLPASSALRTANRYGSVSPGEGVALRMHGETSAAQPNRNIALSGNSGNDGELIVRYVETIFRERGKERER